MEGVKYSYTGRLMMKMYRISVYGLTVAALLVGVTLAGCGGSTAHYGSASIVSEPANVNVVNLEDGSAIGTTPLQYTWETEDVSEKYIQLKLNAEGYADQMTEFFLNSRYGSKEDAEKNPKIISVRMKKAE